MGAILGAGKLRTSLPWLRHYVRIEAADSLGPELQALNPRPKLPTFALSLRLKVSLGWLSHEVSKDPSVCTTGRVWGVVFESPVGLKVASQEKQKVFKAAKETL